ncbi:MAG: phytanoyl-CoA dioxygenase family protein [Alphaproteobacteria bacterium]
MNVNSAARLSRLRADAPATAIIEGVEHAGAVIVEGFVAPDLLARLRAELLPVVEERPLGAWKHPKDAAAGGSFAGTRTKRIGGIVAKSRAFHELVVDPRLLALADRLLLPHCAAYRIHGSQLMAVGPGEKSQLLHRDETDWPHFPKPKLHLTVGAMVALSAFTAENGATRVIPGSQGRDDTAAVAERDIVQAVMPAGSALVYDGKVLHGAGANRTASEWRVGLWFAYGLGWLRQYENQVLACPPEVARTLPPAVARLVGYALHDPWPVEGGVLGGVDTGLPGERDPMLVLARTGL